jgi:hypothetical protein
MGGGTFICLWLLLFNFKAESPSFELHLISVLGIHATSRIQVNPRQKNEPHASEDPCKTYLLSPAQSSFHRLCRCE